MKRRMVWCCLLALGVIPTSATQAATIFESGTLGTTGVTRTQIANEEVRGSNISGDSFTGVRFQLDGPVNTTQIGGHFIKNTDANDSFFGAIVRLDDEEDFPGSTDLSTPDVAGSTLLSFPVTSDEVFGDLNVTLQPGWYALVFGSRLFGATGNGGALRNNPDIGDQDYIAFQPGSGWFNLIDISDAILFKDYRFVIRGDFVPEPSSTTLCCCALLLYCNRSNKRR